MKYLFCSIICLSLLLDCPAQNMKLTKRITFRGITLKVPEGISDLSTQSSEAEVAINGVITIKFGMSPANSIPNAARKFAEQYDGQTSGIPLNVDLADISYSMLRATSNDNMYWVTGAYAHQESYGVLIQYHDPSFQKVAKKIANSVRATATAPTPLENEPAPITELNLDISSLSDFKTLVANNADQLTEKLIPRDKLDNNKTLAWGGLHWPINDQSKVVSTDTTLIVMNSINSMLYLREISDSEIADFKASKEMLYEGVGQRSISDEDDAKPAAWVAFQFLGFCEAKEPIEVSRRPGTTIIPFTSRDTEQFQLSYIEGTFTVLSSALGKATTIVLGIVTNKANGEKVNYQVQINMYHQPARDQIIDMLNDLR